LRLRKSPPDQAHFRFVVIADQYGTILHKFRFLICMDDRDAPLGYKMNSLSFSGCAAPARPISRKNTNPPDLKPSPPWQP
jgi:hypothetical protein